jgi:hypothetical protein
MRTSWSGSTPTLVRTAIPEPAVLRRLLLGQWPTFKQARKAADRDIGAQARRAGALLG